VDDKKKALQRIAQIERINRDPKGVIIDIADFVKEEIIDLNLRINTVEKMEGPQGVQGEDGLQGEQGIPGTPGSIGLQGLRGLEGPQGPTGEGSMGPQGIPGEEGLQGLPGIDGEDGKAPEHRWLKTSLQFKNPDSSWGELVNLRGSVGPQGFTNEPFLTGGGGSTLAIKSDGRLFTTSAQALNFRDGVKVSLSNNNVNIDVDLSELLVNTNDTEVLFNNAGVIDGDSTFTYDIATNVLNLTDDVQLTFGDDDDAVIMFNTSRTNDALMIGVSSSRNLIITEQADVDTDFLLVQNTDPSVIIMSSDATDVTKYLQLAFVNSTDEGVIRTASGDIRFSPASGVLTFGENNVTFNLDDTAGVGNPVLNLQYLGVTKAFIDILSSIPSMRIGTSDATYATELYQGSTKKIELDTSGDIVLTPSKFIKITNGRLLEDKGSDVASANTLTLGNDGNSFDITGTTTVNNITVTDWQSGATITLKFDGVLTVTDQAGGSGQLRLAASSNQTTAANTRIVLQLDGTEWWELSRTVA